MLDLIKTVAQLMLMSAIAGCAWAWWWVWPAKLRG